MGGFLRQLSISFDLSSVDCEMRTGIFAGNNGYSPASGEIVGILKTMHDEMSVDLKTATDDEKVAIAGFTSFVTAKEKEMNALSSAMESEMGHVGDLEDRTDEERP